MIIYEITATVSTELAESYEKYMLEKHIPDLLATEHFKVVYFTRSGESRYRIQYHAHDHAALDDYLRNDATRLRADFFTHFPEGIALTRENWEILKVWQV